MPTMRISGPWNYTHFYFVLLDYFTDYGESQKTIKLKPAVQKFVQERLAQWKSLPKLFPKALGLILSTGGWGWG